MENAHLMMNTLGSAPVGAGSGSPNQSPHDSTPARKRVSQACTPCAKRKTKCDGIQPTCTQCMQRDLHDCHYPESRRNKRQVRGSAGHPYQHGAHSPGMMHGVSPSSIYDRRPSNFMDNGIGNQLEPQFQNQLLSPYQKQEMYPEPPRMSSSRDLDALNHLSAVASAERAKSITPAFLRPTQNRNSLNLSISTSTRLFKVYFNTIHPIWPILYKPKYDLEGYENLPNTLPSPLLYAIYSIAACVQPSYEAGQSIPSDSPSSKTVFDEALLHLSIKGLLRPSIDTCQALVLLALQQHGIAESASAAMFCSMASSMAIDLKLHRAMGPDADPTEVQIRSRLYWNIFVLDKMVATELGRPVGLRWEEQDAPFPSALESDEYHLLSLPLSDPHRPSSVKSHTISGFITTIKLSQVMEKVWRDIYSVAARKAIREDPSTVEATYSTLKKELHSYHESLECSHDLRLTLGAESVGVAAPVSITNYVWVWCATILIERPFINAYGAEPRDTCVMAANKICQILEKYADSLSVLSCDLIFPIYTTGCILNWYSRSYQPNDNGLCQRNVQMCVSWLQVLAKSWKSAGTRQEVLSKDIRPDYRSRGSQTPEPLLHTQHIPQMVASGQESANNEWAFPNNFGDPSDEFFDMDSNFRALLQHQFDPLPQ